MSTDQQNLKQPDARTTADPALSSSTKAGARPSLLLPGTFLLLACAHVALAQYFGFSFSLTWLAIPTPWSTSLKYIGCSLVLWQFQSSVISLICARRSVGEKQTLVVHEVADHFHLLFTFLGNLAVLLGTADRNLTDGEKCGAVSTCVAYASLAFILVICKSSAAIISFPQSSRLLVLLPCCA